jgi:O-antigen/teichoic acid export membrane protein
LSASLRSSESGSSAAPDPTNPGVAAGSLSGFSALGAGTLATAITTPVVLHALGAARFGLWVALVAAVSLTGLFDFGFSQAVARFAGEHRATRNTAAVNAYIVATGAAYLVAFALVLLATTAIGLVFPLVVAVPAAEHGAALAGAILIGVATALGLWMGFFTSILHAYQRLPLANGVRVGYWMSFIVLTIGASIAGLGIVGLASAMAISAGASCLAFVVLVRATVPDLTIHRPKPIYLQRALRYSAFMFLISAGTAVVFETDTLVIAAVIGTAAVSAYAVTLRLTRGLTQFLHKVPDVMFPFYAGMRARGDLTGLRENYLLTARLEIAGAAMVVLGLIFAGRPLIAAWVGATNLSSVSVFALAVALVVMEAIVHPAAILAAATGGEKRMAVFNNSEALLNLGLSIAFAFRFGVTGVIAATVVAQMLTNLWYLPRAAIRQLDISAAQYVRATVGRAIAPAVIGGIAGVAIGWLWPSTIGAFFAAAVAAVVFALTYLRFGAGPEERGWVRAWWPAGARAA